MHQLLRSNRLCRWLIVAVLGLLATPAARAQLTGTKTIPGDYASVAAAITALNGAGVGTGGVTFNIAAGYAETLAAPTAGAITATGTAANPIIFQKSGSGANPVITAGVGTSTTVDAILSLAGADYVTLDGLTLTEAAANTTAAAQMEYGIALFRASATDGAQFNTIRNCVVTLNKTNANTIGIYGAPSASTSTTAVTATATTGANSGNRVYGNAVSNALVGIYFAAGSSTAIANYDQNNEIGSVISPATTATGNSIGNFGGTASGYGAGGTYQNGLKVQGNTINSTLDYSTATPATVAASTITSTLRGVYTPNGTSSNLDITGNAITLASGGTTSAMYGVDNGMGSTPASNTVSISNNSFALTYTLAVTSGSVYGINQSGSPATLNIAGNTISSINQAGTGAVYALYNSQSSTTANVTNNTTTNVTRTGASGSFYGYYNSTGGTTQNLTNNSWSNISVATTSTVAGIYILSSSLESQQISGNTVTGITNTSTGSLYGIYCSYGSSASQVFNNTVTGLSGGGTMGGIYLPNSSLAQVAAYGNTVGNLTNSAASSGLYGIYTTVPTANIYRNKVYGLASTGSSGAAYGIYTASGTTVTIYNNLVGNLTAPSSTGLAASGIYVASGTTVNLTYNTVYLSGTSTGAAFAAAGIYASTTPTLTLLNNIVVNAATPTGTAVSAAYRRSNSTLTTYSTASNNNLFYTLATPTAAQPIYYDGTNTYITLAAYKTAVATRDQASVTENPPFASTTGTAANFLHIATGTPTQVESGGTPVSGITTDYDNDTRSTTTPDIGADEGTFTPLDLTGPSIVFTALGNTSSTGNRTLTATITDPSGISASAPPRIFYRKGTSGAFTSALATGTSGSSYTFTINAATLGGLAAGDVVQYYVVAQDVPGNVSSNPAGGTFTTLPGSAYQYTVLSALSGVYYVGSGTSPDPTRTYTTLTAAATAYNTSGLGGAVTFLLLDATYSTAETFPIAFGNNPEASATNTLTIRPNAGVSSAITGTAAAASVLQLNGAAYITVDGSNTAGGTTRNLTITSAATSGGAAVLVSNSGTQPATNIAVRNLNLAATSSTVGVGISVGGTTVGGTGADDDNVTIQNNSIVSASVGIYAGGTAATSAGGLDGLVITGNTIGAATSGTGSIGGYGVFVANAVAPGVTLNTVQNMSGTTLYGLHFPTGVSNATVSQNLVQNIISTNNNYGINLGTGFTGGTVTRNQILGLTATSSSGYGSKGIDVQTGSATSNLLIANNFVAIVASSGWTTLTSDANVGIRLGTGSTLGGVNMYYNSVSMTGTETYAGSTLSAALYIGSATTAVDIRNNVLRSSIVNSSSSGTGAKTYAFYSAAANTAFTNLNYNDYFVSSTQGVLAYLGSDQTTLAALRTATGKDANSISADPVFASATDLHASAVALNNAGTPIAGITTDIDGETRSTTTPDIGADEFTPLTNDLAPVALLTPAATSTCYGTAEAVSVSIRNAGTAALNFATSPATITVVVTLPGGTTQTLTTTLTTGTLASGATQTVTLPGSLNMSAVGTYSFAITATVAGDGNTGNDLLTPAPTRTVAAPVAGTLSPAATSICISGTATLTLAGAANGSIQFQSSADNVTFTDIAGATSATYTTPTLTTTTYYRAQVRCNTNVATSNVSTITVNNPQVASVSAPQTICAGSTATLTATASAGSNVRFFAAATGGTALATTTAGSYTTPALAAGTTYYAEAYSGGTETVGPAVQTSTGLTAQTGGALYFTATAPVTIQTVTVFLAAGQAAGTVTIDLRTGSSTAGAVVNGQSMAFAVPANSTTGVISYVVPLNYSVPAAGSYTLYLASATQNGLLRDNAGANITGYPYTSPSGTVTITASSLTGYYYYFYNWQLSSECANSTRTAIQVNVTQPATASFPAATASTCGSTGYQLAGTVGGSATTGTYTSSGTGTFAPNATTPNATYTPSAADIAAGSVTITLTSAASAPCPAVTATLALSISPAPVATFSYPAGTYCTSSSASVAPALGSGASAGTFTASPAGLTLDAATGVVTLSSSAAGTYTVTNAIAASGACAATSATATITVTPQTTAGFSYAGAPFCLTGSNPTPAVTGTTGGVFSSTTGLSINSGTGAINLSASTAGTYTVTYAVAGPCASSSTQTVTLTTAPVAAFSYPAGTYCAASGSTIAPTLGTGAAAGTFSSATGLTVDATTGVITLSTSAAGTYTVTNTIAAANGCAAVTATATVTVVPATLAAFSYAGGSFCQTGTNPTATVTGTTGGTFTASPAGLTLDASTGVVTLSTSTLGTYAVTYTVAGPCGSSSTQTVAITSGQSAGFSYPSTTAYCAGSASTVTPTVTGTNGTFASTSGLAINATTGVITLSTSTPGTYTVTNTVAASGGCAAATATTTVTITPATSATFSYSGTTYCVSGTTSPAATVTGTAGGTFSSTTGLTLNATTGAIALASSTPGTYAVTYAVAGPCGSSSTQSVTITAAPVAAFSYGTTTTYCVSGTAAPTVALGTGATAGTFSSTTGLTLNATTGAITLNSSTPGTYTVTNTVAAANGCAAATATTTVTITTAPTAAFSYGTTSSYCVSGTANPTVTLGTGASAGTFSSTTGLTLNATTGAIALSSSTPGTYTVTNTVAAANGCAAATATTTVTITAAPVASFSYGTTATYCVSGAANPAIVLGTGAAAGTFTSTAGLTISATTGAVTLSTSTPGTYTVTNTIAAANGCAAATSTATVTITAAPVAAFGYGTATSYCVSGTSNPTVALGTGATAGTFSSATGLTLNATTGAITLSSSTPGTYTVTNTVAAANGCAATTATALVTITAAPVATFSYPASGNCAGAGTVTPTLGTGATTGAFTSTAGLTINATTGAVNLATSTAGTYTVTNTVAASGGCAAATATATVTVSPAAIANAGPAQTICSGASAQLGVAPIAGTTYSYSPATGLSSSTAANPTVTLSNTTGAAITTTYTLTATTAQGCMATSTVTVTVNPLPATPTYTYTYPTRSTVVFTSSVAPAGTTYQWYLNGVALAGATNQTYTANGITAPGSYSLCIISTATGCRSCTNATTVTATSQPLAGSSLRLFPNPTTDGQLTLQLTGYTKAVRLTVLDALGRVVLTQQVAAGQSQAQLDLSGAATGVYLLRATSDGGTEVRRIVRE